MANSQGKGQACEPLDESLKTVELSTLDIHNAFLAQALLESTLAMSREETLDSVLVACLAPVLSRLAVA